MGMEKLVDGIFNGDQSKVLFGFCIDDCSQTGSNVNSDEAVSIVREIITRFPNFGGAFLWAASDDSANSWSGPVSAALNTAILMPSPVGVSLLSDGQAARKRKFLAQKSSGDLGAAWTQTNVLSWRAQDSMQWGE